MPPSRRLSLRLRLTLLYGACFLIAAGAALAITDGLVARDTSSQTRHLQLSGRQVELPWAPLTVRTGAAGASKSNHVTLRIEQIQISPNGTERIMWTPSSPTATRRWFLGHLSDAQLAKLQVGAQEMSACMRAHGLTFPNESVRRGPGGNGFTVGVSSSHVTLPPAEIRSRAFKTANTTCSQRLERFIPTVSVGENANRLPTSVQKRLNVIVDRVNGALATQRHHSLRALLIWSGVALGAMAVVSILLGWFVAGRGLAPIRTMAAQARRINEENLHERLSSDAAADELGELGATFDDVLARLERAFEAQKRFVANASHELRTPVTLERTLLELALAAPDADAEKLRMTCERVLVSTMRQQQMIEALLTLARSQGGTDVEVPVDLADLGRDVMMLREQRLQGMTVAADLHPAPLDGDPALLERLVANLLDNAIIHNLAEGGWITLETGTTEAGSWLRVSNSGPEVPESMIGEIFEPFRTGGAERTATAAGVGLGLSIVRAIADLHGAAVTARPLVAGGLSVEVRF